MKLQAPEERTEIRAYVWGICLGLLLTLAPFACVHWSALPRFQLLIVIGVCALLQTIVHFRFFLHIGFRQQREDLQLIMFSALLLIIMLGGTIWIMGNLTLRMALPAQL